jgi:hypothetical protein
MPDGHFGLQGKKKLLIIIIKNQRARKTPKPLLRGKKPKIN